MSCAVEDEDANVKCLGIFGSDLVVVNEARVSFDRHTSVLRDDDRRLIRYLAKHGHWTPFAHIQIRFRLSMPVVIARQWFKSSVGVVRSEISRRYTKVGSRKLRVDFFKPMVFREGSIAIKQGSVEGSDVSLKHPEVDDIYDAGVKNAVASYEKLLNLGVCREQARFVLPQSMSVTFIETGSLVYYARIVALRTDLSAQAEIRVYAGLIDDFLSSRPELENVWKALRSEA